MPDDFLSELQPVLPASGPRPGLVPGGVEAELAYPETMPAWSQPAPEPEAGSLQDVALTAMARVLREHRGNVSAAAKALGVSRNTIYRKKDQLPPDVWG